MVDSRRLGMTLEAAVSMVPMLGTVPFESLNAICTYRSLRWYEGNATLWARGHSPDEFTFVVGGRVKLVKRQPTGKDTILDILNPGRLTCANIPYSCGQMCCDAVAAREGAHVLKLLRQHVLELMAKHALLSRAFLEELSCRSVMLCARIEELGAGKVEQRIARLLLRLNEQLGVDNGVDGSWIPFVLSRRDLAELCGTTMETAIRVMSRLEKLGVVDSRSLGFMVRNPKALEQLVMGEPHRSLSVLPDGER
jgi:CRP-like cAMP-binding protein